MVFYYNVDVKNFANIIEAASKAWNLYREINAHMESNREEYDGGRISQAQLLESNQNDQRRMEEAQKAALQTVEENASAILQKVAEESILNTADMDSPDYRALKVDDVVLSPDDLRALKQRNLSSVLIRREVEKYAFSHELKDPDFVNRTNEEDVKNAVDSFRKAALVQISDTTCRGTYGGAFLATVSDPEELRRQLFSSGVLERV